jgi:hypothetical protein
LVKNEGDAVAAFKQINWINVGVEFFPVNDKYKYAGAFVASAIGNTFSFTFEKGPINVFNDEKGYDMWGHLRNVGLGTLGNAIGEQNPIGLKLGKAGEFGASYFMNNLGNNISSFTQMLLDKYYPTQMQKEDQNKPSGN